jgi:GAF domain-containing protein
VDCAPGIEARGMLLRSLVQDGQLFGVMQLINRVNGQFTNEDVNVINYVAERVADFVRQAKLRGRL